MKFRSTHKSVCPWRLLALTSILAFFGGSARATTYYVSTTGSDSNPGTQTAPFRHVSKGVASAKQPDDVVMVMDGTYDNEGVVSPGGGSTVNPVVTLTSSGTSGHPITIRAQNRGGAILDGMNTSTTVTCNGAGAYFDFANTSFIVIQGFVVQRTCEVAFLSNQAAHDITVKWNEIRNIAQHTATDQYGKDGIYFNASEYNLTFDGNSWHDIGRTDGLTHDVSDHGIYGHGATITIINNIFYNITGGWGIQTASGASNWLIANNVFGPSVGPGYRGASEPGQIVLWDSNTSITIENNIFYQPKNGYALYRYTNTLSGTNKADHNVVFGVSSVVADTTGFTATTPNIFNDPSFVNASSAPYDFDLRSGSPAIGAGVYLSAVLFDFDGNARPVGTSADIGAYEYGVGLVRPAPPTNLSIAVH